MIAGGKELGGIYGHSKPYNLYEVSQPYHLTSLGLGFGGAYGTAGMTSLGGLSGGYADGWQKKALPVGAVVLGSYLLYRVWKGR